MAFEKLSDRVRQLIGENDQRAAADLLMQALRDKNPALFNIALVQQANIKKLADQSAAGILSADELNREQAKTNAALLHLSDEYARLYEGGIVKKAFPRWVFFAGAALLVLLVAGWLLRNAASHSDLPATFDLTIRVHGPGDEQMAVTEGKVKLRLGQAVSLEPQALNPDGEVVFRNLSSSYHGDSIHLQYIPDRVRRFKLSPVTPVVLSGQNQTLGFTLEFAPDTTVFAATLRDQGRAISGADISVDGNLHTYSDDNGYFQIAIPKPSGATAELVVGKNGQRLYRQTITITSVYREISIK
ncbi:MAG: hypothetical protein ABIO24_03725 [Saprospiraceae bacterium]